MELKICIVDDHPIFREGFKTVIKSIRKEDQVDEASNGQEFLSKLEKENYNLVFMDINMPIMDGLEATQKAMEKKKSLKIMALTSYEGIEYIDKMLYAGVEGYLLKDASYEEIKKAIEKIIQGENYFSEKILLKLSKRAIVKRDEEKKKAELPGLSKREIEVLELICQGYSRMEIADKLFISERTVDKHKENLQVKTNTKNSVNLVLYSIKNKIVAMNDIINE
ncbi:MAG: response regulator [Bacteroidota bacterium]